MTDDVVFDDRAIGERAPGKDAVRAMVRDMVEHMSSDFRIEQGELVIDTAATWASEWTMSGTNDREDTVHGLPNTGRSFHPGSAAHGGSGTRWWVKVLIRGLRPGAKREIA